MYNVIGKTNFFRKAVAFAPIVLLLFGEQRVRFKFFSSTSDSERGKKKKRKRRRKKI